MSCRFSSIFEISERALSLVTSVVGRPVLRETGFLDCACLHKICEALTSDAIAVNDALGGKQVS